MELLAKIEVIIPIVAIIVSFIALVVKNQVDTQRSTKKTTILFNKSDESAQKIQENHFAIETLKNKIDDLSVTIKDKITEHSNMISNQEQRTTSLERTHAEISVSLTHIAKTLDELSNTVKDLKR